MRGDPWHEAIVPGAAFPRLLLRLIRAFWRSRRATARAADRGPPGASGLASRAADRRRPSGAELLGLGFPTWRGIDAAGHRVQLAAGTELPTGAARPRPTHAGCPFPR
jgi:hypothetical protein